ncbi:MAG: hypothetical protein ACTSRS_16615 [Candidatus Helarchaeota archaeon]
MADEKNSKKIAFEYINSADAREKIPVLQLQIKNPFIKPVDNPWIDAALDTGYDGGLLIPPKLYQELELHKIEFPIDQWDIGETISGEIMILQAALAQIKILGLNRLIELRIETFPGNQKKVLGLNGIKTLLLCLNGPKEKIEICTHD